ncbi:unnamed protein product [Prunus armeniaca]
MKNRLRSLVVFDDGCTNGLVVFDDLWWSSMIVGGLEVSGVEVEEVSGGEVETSREGVILGQGKILGDQKTFLIGPSFPRR